ncbi:hypothetical protein chiPu_0018343 [Chiloscyllium punctatum]|uniref:Cadherin domain-containing protein n=1 Tax=Chiloscyllium punctatum TaxID=137246 RepID=A0A401RMP6_CHIPU|nr:hypothetical protein [Chiloscyllium punctatum]
MGVRLGTMLMDIWTRLMLAWISVLPLVQSITLDPPQSLQEESILTLNGLDGDPGALSRAKRGWVWNQMFVLEEFSGPEPILVGRLHTDLDLANRNVKYILSGEGAGTIFMINDKTGDIHAMKRLDREEKAEYTLTAQAIDRDTDKPLEPPSEFIIKVQDINDNAPEFPDEPYHVTVPEMSSVGTSVMGVTATDADDPVYGNSAKLVYSILEGQPYFSIEPHTGIIRTALPNMDREAREEYLVVIQAKDMGGHMGGLSGTTTVTVTLTDVNDNPPKFTQSLYHLSVLEDMAVGDVTGRVKANDRDLGQNARSLYEIIDGDGMDVFEITTDSQTQEGVITLKKPLDFETKRSYTLKVEAGNAHIDPRFISKGPFKDTAAVKITVEDADEPPVFSSPAYFLEVRESVNVGSVIGQIMARDPDIIVSPVSQVSRVPVAIKVLDVNDNAPELASQTEAYLCENGKSGQVIQTVSATDKDDPKAGQYFFYNLAPEISRNPNFTIKNNADNSVSILARHSGFSRQKQDIYFLPIIISDSGNPPMSSTNTLTIRVCGCSTDGTVQSCNVEAFVLPIGLSMGALIAILACIILLLVIVVLFVTLRRHKNEPLIIKDDEDVRENIIRYDDEGGGEEDTEAFDIATLQNPDGFNGFLPRKDIKPDLQYVPRQSLPPVPNGVDVDEFINVRLHDADIDPTAPPYDSIQIYGYEGRGSTAGSLSSLETTSTDSEQNFDYLKEWGPRFKKLGDMYAVGENDRET